MSEARPELPKRLPSTEEIRAAESLAREAPIPGSVSRQGEDSAPSEEAAVAEPAPCEVIPESRPEAPASGSSPNPVEDRVELALERAVARILDAFEGKLAYDAAKQLQVDRLHEELQQHRSDLVSRATRPLVRGVIQLHHDIGNLLKALRAKPAAELTPERFFLALEGLQEDVSIVLGHQGIEPFEEPGVAFISQRQTAVRKVPTADVSRVGTVAERLRPGFSRSLEILDKERVAVYESGPAPASDSTARDQTPTDPALEPIYSKE